MKFTLSWLKDHLETDATLDVICDTLTAIGLEVEAVTDPAAALSAFVVGEVISAERHPDADRLQVCMVDTGEKTIQVVCGAPNARAGMKGVFAPAGSHIPGTGVDLKSGVIRGVESHGMLCSEREMGLSEDHDGIIELAADAPVGGAYADVAGLNDPVIEIAITPNRQDALGVYGIARDLAAAGIGTLKTRDDSPFAGDYDSPVLWRRDLPADAQDACPMAVGRYFRGVKNGPSPAWMQDRLRAIGLRPISALVDITNYVAFDLGRPLHVFDADRLSGNLTMRLARDGEEIAALDGRTYSLDDSMVVIGDDRDGVLGIGGVMGGEETGCQPETTNVFLEVALFDPVRVATTGRKLGIHSDARYRFERGVDPESMVWGVENATRLILSLCGGSPSKLVSAGAIPNWQRTVAFRPARVAALGGVAVPEDAIERILTAQGFDIVSKGDGAEAPWQVAVPSWRMDVETGEADLVEDVLRHYGYDNIPAVPLTTDHALPRQTLTPQQRRIRLARRALAGRGLLEAVTWSFMPRDHAKLFGGGGDSLELLNPISADLSSMRPSILPNLLSAAQRNSDRGYQDSALFEIGPDYQSTAENGQRMIAAAVRVGQKCRRHWDESPRSVDVYDAKADVLSALAAAGAPVDNLQVQAEGPSWYHPGRVGALKLGNRVLAHFGEIHPRVLKILDVKGPAVGFELDFGMLPPVKTKSGKVRPLLRPSPFQPFDRDFAFVVDADVPADAIVRAAMGADKKLISDASIFDVYVGAGVAEGKKSVAIALTLAPQDATLTDAEIDAISEKIVANVAKHTGGQLRG